jgi:hypothetical protein
MVNTDPPSPPPKVPAAHLLVFERVVRRVVRGTGKTYTFERTSRRDLWVDDRVYDRDVDVGVEWVPIDVGWVKDPSAIVVSTCSRTEDGAVVVGVRSPADGSYVPFAEVFPGKHVRIDPPGIALACAYGVRASDPGKGVRVTITAFPG